MEASGLRIGTPALVTRGFAVEDFEEVGRILATALGAASTDAREQELSGRVQALVERYPLYEFLGAPRTRRAAVAPDRSGAATLNGSDGPPRRARRALRAAGGRGRDGDPDAADDAPGTPSRHDRRTPRAGPVRRPTPLLGGLAIFGGVLVAALVFLPSGYASEPNLWSGVLLGAAIITLVGALDDRFDLHPVLKLAGQFLAAVVVVHFGVGVRAVTLPFFGHISLPNAGITDGGPLLTVVGLVVMMNVVNFSDGVDGLAAGVCAIIAATMAVIAFDLDRPQPGVLAALTAGAALGFLIYNFPPAKSFMGDCGANLLGLLMGVIAVEAAVKTAAVVSLVLPLILLAVPFLDTTFVVLKRLKYRSRCTGRTVSTSTTGWPGSASPAAVRSPTCTPGR